MQKKMEAFELSNYAPKKITNTKKHKRSQNKDNNNNKKLIVSS